MSNEQQGFGSLFVGFYAWVVTIFFGAILLDIVYASFLKDNLGATVRTTVFSDVSDVLLRIGVVTVLASIGAIATSRKSAAARNLLIASLFFVTLEFLIPVFFSPFSESVEKLNLGPLLRIVPTGLASILALVGLYNYTRQK